MVLDFSDLDRELEKRNRKLEEAVDRSISENQGLLGGAREAERIVTNQGEWHEPDELDIYLTNLSIKHERYKNVKRALRDVALIFGSAITTIALGATFCYYFYRS